MRDMIRLEACAEHAGTAWKHSDLTALPIPLNMSDKTILLHSFLVKY